MPARTQRAVAPIRGQSSATVTRVATTSSGADWKISEKGEREMRKGYAWIWREASGSGRKSLFDRGQALDQAL
jgi:hypothetical protein